MTGRRRIRPRRRPIQPHGPGQGAPAVRRQASGRACTRHSPRSWPPGIDRRRGLIRSRVSRGIRASHRGCLHPASARLPASALRSRLHFRALRRLSSRRSALFCRPRSSFFFSHHARNHRLAPSPFPRSLALRRPFQRYSTAPLCPRSKASSTARGTAAFPPSRRCRSPGPVRQQRRRRTARPIRPGHPSAGAARRSLVPQSEHARRSCAGRGAAIQPAAHRVICS